MIATTGPERQPSFLGHPVQLATLSFAEMWERFSYYGMRALLVPYRAAVPEQGGLGSTPANAGAASRAGLPPG